MMLTMTTEFDRIIEGKSCALLYPSSSALDVTTIHEDPALIGRLHRNILQVDRNQPTRPFVLVAIDGTWIQAQRLYRWNPRLQAMPQVCIHITIISMINP